MTVHAFVVNLQAMGKKKAAKTAKVKKKGRGALIMVLCVAALAAACACVYLFAFTRMTFVVDDAFLQVYPRKRLLGLRLGYAAKGIRLSVLKLDEDAFYSEDMFTSELSKAGGKTVVLSPLASDYVRQNVIMISQTLPDSTVVGITMEEGFGLFDAVLVPDEVSGWTEAAQSIAAETSKMAQNVALVYSYGNVNYIEDIVSCFPVGHGTTYERGRTDSHFVRNTLADMDREGILVALCPYVVNLYSFFNSDTSVKWVVDYRFADVVPEKNLYAVVIPDFSIFAQLNDVEKGAGVSIDLTYVYEKK